MKKTIALATLFAVSAPAFAAVKVVQGADVIKSSGSRFTGRIVSTEVITEAVKIDDKPALETSAVSVTVENATGGRVVVNFSKADMPIGVSLGASEGKDASIRVDTQNRVTLAIGRSN